MQFLNISTSYRKLPFSVIVAVNVSVVTLAPSVSRFQIPRADPAAIAAPRAVVSGIEGRTRTNTMVT